jgi:DnaJ family protein C protein 7
VIEADKIKANDLFKKGHFRNAYNAYTKLLELDPENKNFCSLILANRALCLQNEKKLIEALTDINQSIKNNENYAKAHLRRGHINKDLGNFDDARYDYEKVKQLEPSNRAVNKLIEEAKVEAKKAQKKDYYKILKIEKNAKPEQIKKAYRKLAPKYHPDKNHGSEELKKNAEKMFRDVSEAYQVLYDPKKRQMYDSGFDPNNPEQPSHTDPTGSTGFSGGFPGSTGGFTGSSGFSGSSANIDPEEIFKMFFGGGGAGGFKGFSGFGGGEGPEIKFNMGGNSSGNARNFTNFEGGNPFGGSRGQKKNDKKTS